MKLEQQVCSLELAKKLKALGAKQESLFYWKASNGMLEKYSDIQVKAELVYGKMPRFGTLGTWDAYSAFTVAELGEMLPWRIEHKNRFYVLECEKGGKPWYWVNYKYGDSRWVDYDCWTQESDNEADARAKMLIYLLENKLITL